MVANLLSPDISFAVSPRETPSRRESTVFTSLRFSNSEVSLAALRLLGVLAAVLVCVISIQAQPTVPEHPGDPNAKVIEGVNNTTVFGMGQSLRIVGVVKEGAIAFGGDVIVEGTVDGDVAAIGGSVIQREGSRIGGDVIVLGGIYHHGKAAPGRDPKSVTIMYAGYEDQLRQVMREPFSLLRPQLSPAFFGIRLLAILFWFIIALAFTAAMPNTVSRAVARLQLTSIRVALIGLLGSIVITVGVFLGLLVLPPLVGVVISILAVLLVIVATLFGRVVISAATGRWLQRRFFPKLKSESVVLLMGVTFWVIMASLPYVWPVVVAGLLVISLGLALTARYRLNWKKSESDKT
ncbi:MAG TPA: polymer-forming cytoskeletal protein [Pyrinomonadaceae bacterium]|nr:polymer-forming cytoskeletal protein [Pyrinomonadaceae bacterium]